MSDEQTQQTTDDPSGPGWRDVEPDELLQDGDMLKNNTGLWLRTRVPGRFAREGFGGTYRRRIEPQQASDSEPETMEDLRRRLAECEVLLAEAERSGEQVNAELQQLREQVRDLTQQAQLDAVDLQQLREQLRIELDAAQQVPFEEGWNQGTARAVETVLEWLEPIRAVDSEHLANETLQHLPQIMRHLTGLAQD